MQFEIPQDIIDITRQCHWELSDYHEFDISLTVSKDGKVMVRDMLGLWADDKYEEDLMPEEAWSTIRKWWADEEENIAAKQTKQDIKNQIAELQKDLETLETTAKKKKWFW